MGRSAGLPTSDMSQLAGRGGNSGLLPTISFNKLLYLNDTKLVWTGDKTKVTLNKSNSLLANGILADSETETQYSVLDALGFNNQHEIWQLTYKPTDKYPEGSFVV